MSSGGSQGVDAEAGPDQLVQPNEDVVLDASALTDVDGIETFQWSQDSGTSVTLTNADTPRASFTAPGQRAVLVFTLTTTDGFGATGEDQVTVTVNVPPTANDDSADAGTNDSVTIDVAANDTDDDAVRPDSLAIVAQPDNGSVETNADGTVTYTRAGRRGREVSFRYTIDDSDGATSNEATVSVTVGLVNTAPVARNDADSVDEGGQLDRSASAGVLANDTDADGDDLTAVLESGPSNAASFDLRADGSYTYRHDGSETASDSFSYRADDGFERSEVATVSITVNPVNDPPVARDDNVEVDEDTPTPIDVVANDFDPDGTLAPDTVVITRNPSNGSLDPVDADGSVTYTPAPDFNGGDSFQYTVDSADGVTSAPATVTIAVNAVNDPPVVTDETYTVAFGGAIEIPASEGVRANDTDAETPTANLTVELVTGPESSAAFNLAPGGAFGYTHNGQSTAPDTFEYRVSDGDGGSATGTATINIELFENSSCWTVSGGETLAARLDDSARGLDPPLRYALTQDARQGQVRMTDAARGSFRYTPHGNARGSDTFAYTIEDADGDTRSDEATVITDPRLMPLGGSVTAGVTNAAEGLPVPERRVGYRKPLQTELAEAGYAMNFVGSQTFGNAVSGFDYQSEAHAGRSPRALALGSPSQDVNYPNTGVYTWLQRSPADFVLLQPGTQALGTAGVDGVEAMLDEIDRYEQDFDTQVRVMLTPALNRDAADPRIAAFNEQLAAMVKARVEDPDNPADPDPIVMVDRQNVPAAPADFADSKHPNTAGYEKMAQAWLAAIRSSCRPPPGANP